MRNWQPAAITAVAVTATAALGGSAWATWTKDTSASVAAVAVAATSPASAPTSAATPVATWTATPSTPTTPTTAAASPTSAAPVVYLTIDDGPDPENTPKVLAVLREAGVPATFFMIGEQAQKHPELVAAVRADGHAVGNHTYTHPWLSRLGRSGIRSELEKADGAIGGRVTCMRAPGGFVNAQVRSVARSMGLPVIGWTADTRDWARPGTARIVAVATAGTLSRTEPRTVLVHDGGGPRAQTIAALPRIIAGLKAKGAVFETVPACRG